MLNKIILALCILIALINLNASLSELLPKQSKKLIAGKDTSFVLALSLISTAIIYIGIKSIGLIAILLSSLAGLLIFLVSINILQDEPKNKMGKK